VGINHAGLCLVNLNTNMQKLCSLRATVCQHIFLVLRSRRTRSIEQLETPIDGLRISKVCVVSVTVSVNEVFL
jgi:hypothetical protein